MQLCFVLGHPLDFQGSAKQWDWTLSLYQNFSVAVDCQIITVKLAYEMPFPEGQGRRSGEVFERICEDALCVAFLPTVAQS